MKSIIQKLWGGEIYPMENVKVNSENFKKAQEEYQKIYDSLANELNNEQKQILESIIDGYACVESFYSYEYYKEGLITGIRLMDEVIHSKEK